MCTLSCCRANIYAVYYLKLISQEPWSHMDWEKNEIIKFRKKKLLSMHSYIYSSHPTGGLTHILITISSTNNQVVTIWGTQNHRWRSYRHLRILVIVYFHWRIISLSGATLHSKGKANVWLRVLLIKADVSNTHAPCTTVRPVSQPNQDNSILLRITLTLGERIG